MAVNVSSNDSFLHPPIPMPCLFIRPTSLLFTTYYIGRILVLLPLCILVLYLGLQRWQRQRSTSTAAMSHSDTFTYHMTIMELISVFGTILCCFGVFLDHLIVLFVGLHFWALTWYGETFFHSLTCVEHYLAVVHPVTYLSLRGERGIRIRNISIGCVWLVYFGGIGLMHYNDFLIVDFCLLIFSLIVVSFCSLSVLHVLIRPGPGEQGGDRERVDQTKRKAFYTISAILGVLLLRCFASLTWTLIHMSDENECMISTMVEFWLNLPSSVVLPLLFLHRAGTLACCKNNTQ